MLGSAHATPIRPDIKKMLDTPRPQLHFVPARVGWNGPEGESAQAAQVAAIEHYGAAAQQRGIQQILLQLATPDWRIFLGLGMLIMLLRVLRRRTTPARAVASYPVPVDAIEPIRPRRAA